MAKALTGAALTKFKATTARQEIPDGVLTGLYFVVQPTGRKSWAVRYRHEGKPTKMALGNFLAGDDPARAGEELRRIRRQASEILESVRAGDNPAATKQAEKKQPKDGDLFENAVKTFLEAHKQGRATKRQAKRTRKPAERTVEEARRYLEKFADVWKGKRLQEITKRTVQDALDEMAEESPVAANRAHTYLRMFFEWAVFRDRVTASPVAWEGVPESSRDRVLSLDEIKLFWRATGDLDWPFQPMFRMLLLTGQRRDEVAQMKRNELNGSTWTIPSERTKNRREHVLPLPPEVMAIIEAAPKIAGKSGYVFTTNGETFSSGYSRATRKVRKAMERVASEEAGEPVTIPNWSLHDLRRSFSTHASDKIGIEPHIVEAVLNHVSGGVAGIYNRAKYLVNKQAALEAWGRFVIDLVECKADSNVVPLRA